jgi:hypothetical protein
VQQPPRDDEQRVAAEPGELGLELAGAVGPGEGADPVGGGGEQDPVRGLAGADGQPGGEVGFARTRATSGGGCHSRRPGFALEARVEARLPTPHDRRYNMPAVEARSCDRLEEHGG